jgi:predicted RNA polymerase sigma factor
MAYDPAVGLTLVDEIAQAAVPRNYAPLPAARGDILFRAGRKGEARIQLEHAAGFTRNERVKAALLGRAAACGG